MCGDWGVHGAHVIHAFGCEEYVVVNGGLLESVDVVHVYALAVECYVDLSGRDVVKGKLLVSVIVAPIVLYHDFVRQFVGVVLGCSGDAAHGCPVPSVGRVKDVECGFVVLFSSDEAHGLASLDLKQRSDESLWFVTV